MCDVTIIYKNILFRKEQIYTAKTLNDAIYKFKQQHPYSHIIQVYMYDRQTGIYTVYKW